MDAEIKNKLEEMACAQVKKAESRRKIFGYVHEDYMSGAQAAWTLAVEWERKRIVEIIKRERREYCENAERCDASGNTMGGTFDCVGASTCDGLIAAILTPEEVKSE